MLSVQLSCSQSEYSKEGPGLHLHEDPQVRQEEEERERRTGQGGPKPKEVKENMVWRENFIGLGSQEETGSFEKTVPPRKKREGTISQRLR